MPIPYRVETLDEVPEAVRELYEEDGDGFRLPVEGVKTPDEISGLESALDKIKRERNELREKAGRVSDEDLEELARLRQEAQQREEKKAKEEGRWDELRAKLAEEHKKALTEVQQNLQQRESVIENLTITNELRSALAKIVRPELQEAAEAVLMKRNPKVVWGENGEMPKGVFPDEVHGDKPISEYVEEWAQSEAAEPYLPPKQAGGSGATGREGKAPPTSKQWAEMTPDEKVAYTEAKYGGGAAA